MQCFHGFAPFVPFGAFAPNLIIRRFSISRASDATLAEKRQQRLIGRSSPQIHSCFFVPYLIDSVVGSFLV
jgi:hypothetical protein